MARHARAGSSAEKHECSAPTCARPSAFRCCSNEGGSLLPAPTAKTHRLSDPRLKSTLRSGGSFQKQASCTFSHFNGTLAQLRGVIFKKEKKKSIKSSHFATKAAGEKKHRTINGDFEEEACVFMRRWRPERKAPPQNHEGFRLHLKHSAKVSPARCLTSAS